MTSLIERVRIATRTEAVNQLARLIGLGSDKPLATIWRAFEWLARTETDRQEARKVRWLIETGHPFGEWLKRVGREMSPRTRRALIANMYGHAWFLNKSGPAAQFQEREGFFPPTFIVIDVTQRCNLRCPGCWAGAYKQQRDIPMADLHRVIHECRDQIGMHFFVLSGGEPLMRRDLPELFTTYQDCQFLIYTNGTLIDEQMTRDMEHWGNVMPMLSVEGTEEPTDARRGQGTFKKVATAMWLLHMNGVCFGFSATATRHNAEGIVSDEFITRMLELGCLYGWYFQYIPIGRDPDTSLMVTPEQRNYMRHRVYRLRNTRPIFLADFWNDGPEVDGCMAGGKRYLHLTNNGDIEPCVFCHFATHNIKDSTIQEALRSPFFTDIRQGIPYDGNVLRACMLIDRPEVFRRYYEKHHPRATHKGGEGFVTKLASDLDRNAQENAAILDRAWRTGDWMKLYPDPPVGPDPSGEAETVEIGHTSART